MKRLSIVICLLSAATLALVFLMPRWDATETDGGSAGGRDALQSSPAASSSDADEPTTLTVTEVKNGSATDDDANTSAVGDGSQSVTGRGAFDAAALRRRYESESRHREWADSTEGYLLGHIAQTAGLTVTTLQVECRQTTCRVQIRFPSEADFRASAGLLGAVGEVQRARNLHAFQTTIGGTFADVYFVQTTMPLSPNEAR